MKSHPRRIYKLKEFAVATVIGSCVGFGIYLWRDVAIAPGICAAACGSMALLKDDLNKLFAKSGSRPNASE